MLIGLSGKIGTGKSTLGLIINQIVTGRGGQALGVSFGSLLKGDCANQFSFDVALTLTHEGKDQVILHPDLPGGTMSVRKILQWWGTDICRRKDPDYWVKWMAEAVDPIINIYDVIVIDDIRFPNEAEFVLDRDGYLVRVDTYPGWTPGPDADHRSETALDNWDLSTNGHWHMRVCPEYGDLEHTAEAILAAAELWEQQI